MKRLSFDISTTIGVLALGHVFMGGGNPMNDFVTDNKQPKKTARMMMLMVRDLNARFGAEMGKPAADVTQVQCVTCHRPRERDQEPAEVELDPMNAGYKTQLTNLQNPPAPAAN